jgi:hypothetical protein
MNLAYLILAALFGQYSHYYVRWKGGRTTSTFKEYMLQEWPGTVQSIGASIMGCIGTYIALPEPMETKMLLGIIYAAYTSSYMFDSAFNKDPHPSMPIKKYEETLPNKSLDDILRDDRDL